MSAADSTEMQIDFPENMPEEHQNLIRASVKVLGAPMAGPMIAQWMSKQEEEKKERNRIAAEKKAREDEEQRIAEEKKKRDKQEAAEKKQGQGMTHIGTEWSGW